MSVLDLFRRNEYVHGKVVDKYKLSNGNLGLIVEDAATRRRYSKDTGTLTVRPPKPLLDFHMRVSDAGSTDTRVEAQLRELIRRSGNIAQEGDGLPERVRQQMLLLDRVPVTHSRYSANRTLEQIEGASRLGGERFGDRSAVVLDGLPEPRPVVGMLQLWKMKLDILSGPGWRRLRKSLHYDILGKNRNVQRMDEAALLGELQQGNRNTVVLIAHNAEGRIYFPDGKSIEIQKIAQLEREVTPGRAVVLITCEAGGTGGRMPSLAETLLKNRIAASVFASPHVIDAARLPRLLQDLAAKPLRDALRPYHIEQYVGLEGSRYG